MMNIVEIPKILFKEFSEKLGNGKKRKVITNGIDYLLQELNKDIAGFDGTIGIRESTLLNGLQRFVLWNKVPIGEDAVFPDSNPVCEIVAGPEGQGTWVYGSGRKMRETCKLYSDRFNGIDLKRDSSKLIPSILQRALELSSEAEYEEFWEKDRDKKGDYTKSPNYLY